MKVVKLHNQDYESLFLHSARKGVPFVDSHFPPNNRSIYPTQSVKVPIEWRRVRDLSIAPKLVQPGHGAFENAVTPGLLGDCWLLPAIRVLRTHKALFDQVVPRCKEQDWVHAGQRSGVSNPRDTNVHPGIFRFRFYRFGQWVEVVVDDYLPLYSTQKQTDLENLFPHDQAEHRRLVFGRSNNEDEWWCSLMEKAYAKLCGSYQALEIGSPEDALVDLSGSIPERLDLTDEKLVQQIGTEGFCEMLKRAREQNSLMSASLAPLQDETAGDVLPNGLIIGHSYSIDGLHRLSFGSWNKTIVNLIKLHNTADREWNGPWSATSALWKHVADSVKKELNDTEESFYMTIDDFLDNFTELTICRNVDKGTIWSPPSWKAFSFHDAWAIDSNTAGGSVNHAETFHKNPQYLVSVTKLTYAIISLMQKDRRDTLYPNQTIGFVVLRVENNRSFRIRGPDHEIVSRATYMNAREVSGRVALSPGRYVIIPSTLDPDQENEFYLRLFFNHKPRLCKPLTNDIVIRPVDHEFSKQAWASKLVPRLPKRSKDLYAGLFNLQILSAELTKPQRDTYVKIMHYQHTGNGKKPKAAFNDMIQAGKGKTSEPDFQAAQYIFPVLWIPGQDSDVAPTGSGLVILQLWTKTLLKAVYLGEIRINIGTYTSRARMNQTFETSRVLTRLVVLPSEASAQLIALGGADAHVGEEYMVEGMMPRPLPQPRPLSAAQAKQQLMAAKAKTKANVKAKKAGAKVKAIPGIPVDEDTQGIVRVKLPDGRWARKEEAGTGHLRYRISFVTD